MRVASQNHQRQTLASYLRTVQGNRSIRKFARDLGLSSHSELQRLLDGQPPSIETLALLAEHTGLEMSAIAEMAGIPVKGSANRRDRADRIAAMVAARPRLHALVEFLPELTDDEVDTLLSAAEVMRAGRRKAQ